MTSIHVVRHSLAGTLSVLLAIACSATPSGSSQGIQEDSIVVQVPLEVASSGRPAVYFRDPANRDQLLAYSWSGVLTGKVLLHASEPFAAEQSADGTRLLITGAELKSGGTVISKVPDGQWADDPNHLCGFADSQGRTSGFIQPGAQSGAPIPAWLYEASVSGPVNRVVRFGAFGIHGGPVILACSSQHDRAVVAEQFTGQISNLEVVRLSNGSVAYTFKPGPDSSQVFDAVASADAHYIAVGNTLRSWSFAQNQISVIDTTDGTVKGTVTGSGIVAFSSDDSRIMTVQYQGGGTSVGLYRLIDWRSGSVLWSGPGGPGTVRALPNSGDFMMGFRHYVPNPDRVNSLDPREDVIVVHQDGSTQTILHDAFPIK
jgi:hypothetical protein